MHDTIQGHGFDEDVEAKDSDAVFAHLLSKYMQAKAEVNASTADLALRKAELMKLLEQLKLS